MAVLCALFFYRMRYLFPKTERLKSEKIISALFRNGRAFFAYPLRVVWLPLHIDAVQEPTSAEPVVKISVSVPKRAFKSAVARNKLRRQIREAYRQNKHLLYEKIGSNGPSIGLMLIYTPKESLPYKEIELGIRKMIRKFEF